MPIDVEKVCQRLRAARLLLDYSVADVSELTGINAQRIENIESGSPPPSGDEVLILAAAYDRNFLDFIEESDRDPFEQTEILFRRYGNSFGAADKRAVQEFLYLCEIEHHLETQLGRRREQSFFPSVEGSYFKGHGEQAAEQLRRHLGYEWNQVPADLYGTFRALGIHIFRRRLASRSISGLYIEHHVAGHCVLVNHNEDVYRQRFSTAHEVAHAFFDSSRGVVVSFVDMPQRGADDYYLEARANQFASHFLLPPETLERLPRSMEEADARLWANRLHVSTAALAIALRNAGIATPEQAQVIRNSRVPREDKTDPEAPASLTDAQRERRTRLLNRGLSDYYVGLCFDAYHAGHISAGRLTEALRADHAEMREISVLFGRSIKHEH